MNETERAIFGKPQRKDFKDDGTEIDKIEKEDLLHMTKRSLDDFTFMYGSIACSIEHRVYKECLMDEGNKTCLPEANEYGICIYKRFDKT